MFKSLFQRGYAVFVMIALLSTLLGSAPVMTAQAAAGPCSRTEDFKHHFRIGKACRMPNGMLRLKLANGKFVETHGLDAPGRLEAPMLRTGASAESGMVTAAAAPTPYVCSTDARRVVAIYAYPSDAPNRSSTYIPYIRQQFQDSNNLISSTAANFGVSLSLKVACDPDGQITVKVVQMGFPRSQTDVEPVLNDLGSKGYSVTGQRNWIWFDGDTCGGGVALGFNDDRPGVENSLNNAIGYAISWGNCPYTYILHEGTHEMGAVPSSAPHSTGAGHCTDDSDVMCYNDGGPNAGSYRSNVCPGTGLDDFYDCNNDDYFHPNPPVGSYLASHWNIAGCNNLTIVRSGCGTSSPTPTRTSTQIVGASPTATRTRTPTAGPTSTRTRTPTGPTATFTRTATTGPTPTRTHTPAAPTATPTSGSVSTCSPVSSTIAAPFTYDGTGTFCWQSSNLGGYINSWNTSSVTINGVNITNLYMAAGSYPAKINGYWYVNYNGLYAWSHFEAK